MMDSSIVSSTKLQIAAEEFYFHTAVIIFATQLAFLILKTIVYGEEDAMKLKEWRNAAISLPCSNEPPIHGRRVTWWPPTFRIVGKQEEKKIFLRAYRHRGAFVGPPSSSSSSSSPSLTIVAIVPLNQEEAEENDIIRNLTIAETGRNSERRCLKSLPYRFISY